MDPGVYPDIPEDEYRSWDLPSRSDIVEWIRGKSKIRERDAILGRAFHALELERDAFGERYGRMDKDYDLRTKAGRAAMEAWAAVNPDKIGLQPSECVQLSRMSKILRRVDEFPRMMEQTGFSEVSIVADLFGVRCKGRLDRFVEHEGKTLIADIKTTHTASPAEFVEHIGKYGYANQAAFYRLLVHAATDHWSPFAWFCVSKRADVAWFQLCDPVLLEIGEGWCKDTLTLWKRYHND